MLDSAAIAAHCGTADGFVVSWTDQSGNGNDATQSTTTSQPKIYDGTTQAVITENGKPTIQYGYRKFLDTGFDTSAAAFDLPQTFYVALRMISYTTRTNWNKVEFYVAGTEGFVDLGKFELKATPSDTIDTVSSTYRTTSTDNAIYSGTPTSMYLHGAIFGSSSANTYVNGSAGTAVSISESDYPDKGLTLGASEETGEGTFNMSEAIIWPSDQQADGNRTAIESNINEEYLIYQPTDTPTSGLLATYSGAAAAYSVRQLADTAVISMTVRRDSDDEEINIGFDSNGDLDTQAIANFCQTANGYVTRWWDQSTNGNHASQGTAGLQPQIYDGTAVITSGSLPALYSVDASFLQATQGTITDASVLAVYQLSSTDTDTYAINNNISGSRYRLRFFSGRYYLYLDGITWAGNNYSAGSRHLHSFYDNGSTVYWRTNGGDELNRAFTSSISYENITGQLANDVLFQEYIVFDSNQYSNRTDIESDINTYYSIYT